MLCPSCNGFRPANNAPCPLCNAPAPLVNDAWGGQNVSFPGNQNQAAFAPSWGGSGVGQNDWGGQNASFPGSQNQAAWGGSGVGQNDWGGQNASFPGNQNQAAWGGSGVGQNDWGGSSAGQMAFPSAQPQFGGSGAQQIAFPTASLANFGGSGAQQMAFPMPGDGSDNSFWSQNMATRSTAGADRQQSLLPVPYQGQPDFNAQALSVLPTSFPTIDQGIQPVNPFLPALPDGSQDAPVYVAPMYTKPRPIIPRYRAVSGLISVIIVFSLLCGGAGYYAQVTGKLTFFEKLMGVYTPPSIASGGSQGPLPIPSNQVVQGPAANIIYSVGISNQIDQTTGLVPVEVNQFTVGERIWLACSANPAKDGTITVQWYSNGNHYRDFTSPAHGKKQNIFIVPIVFGLPTEGKAMVYWNDQLAATVLFVVQRAA